jgi:4-hydroxybenzoate polyprenyltransferase
VFWTLGFDTVYAIPDRDYDKQLGVNSSALFFGAYTPQAVGLFFAGAALLLAAVGLEMALGPAYWLGWLVAVGFWLTHYRQLNRYHQPPRVFARIFRQNVWVGFILLVSMILGA